MVEVEMTKDIRDYETKLFGLITARQVICLGIGVAYAAPIAMLIKTDFANQCMIGALLMIPVILAGWVTVYGMKMEKFVIQVLRSMVLTPRDRKYKKIDSAAYLHVDQNKKQQKKKKIIKSPDYVAMK